MLEVQLNVSQSNTKFISDYYKIYIGRSTDVINVWKNKNFLNNLNNTVNGHTYIAELAVTHTDVTTKYP